jgi:hypothetical protein
MSKKKTKKTSKKEVEGKKKEKNDFETLLEIVSGEKKLREKEEKIKKAKREAKKQEKQKRREGIVKEEVKLEDDPTPKRKIVQNIKLFEWSAPDRYQFKFNNKWFLVIVIFSLLLSLLLAVLRNYLLMAAIMSMLFLLYVAGTTKPVTVKHKITARGIDTGGKLYEWYMLDNFFFAKKDKTIFLIVETKLNLPKSLIFLVKKDDKDPVFVLLQDKLLYKDIRKWKWLDELSYGEYIPLEKV